MATVKQFEDLLCWQRARELTKFIYDISKYRNFEMDRGLQDQIRRAAVSVMSNIAEGFDRGTRQELINYFYIAKGSCGEVKSQLYIAYDSRYIDMSTFRNGLLFSDECSRLLQSFIQKVKQASHTGIQYKREKSKAQLEREEFDQAITAYLEEVKENPNATFDLSTFEKSD